MRRKFRRGTSFVLSTLLTVMMVFGNFTMPVTAEGTGESKEPEIASENTSENTTEVTPEDSSEKSSETPSEDSSEETSEEQVPLLRGAYSNNNSLGGSGTQGDPYLIEDEDDWNAFAANINAGTDVSAYYKLTNTTPITVTEEHMAGTLSHPFEGHFDGNNKTINANINHNDYAAAPFSYIKNATIENVNVTGSVRATNHHSAGLVSYSYSGTNTIRNCTVSAQVNADYTGNAYSGAIVGHAKDSTLIMSDCLFNGTISSASSSYRGGGLVGWGDNPVVTITDSIFAGTLSVSNPAEFHPIAMHTDGSNYNVQFVNCSNMLYTVGPNKQQSGYYRSDVGDRAYNQPETDLICKKITIRNVDFYKDAKAEIQGIAVAYPAGSSLSYSVLLEGEEATENTDYTAVIKRGDVTVSALDVDGDYTLVITGTGAYSGSVSKAFKVSPLNIILTQDDWNDFVSAVASGATDNTTVYQLGADITVTQPVGTSSKAFHGIFNGNGYTITANISDTAATTSGDGTALFRYIQGATISNLTVAGTVNSQGNHTAGLVAFALKDDSLPNTITNCTVSANINGGKYIGGIVGHGKSSTLNMSDCVFSGTILPNSPLTATAIGGLIGWNDASTITLENCLFKGNYGYTDNFHPVALKTSDQSVTGSFTNVFYKRKPSIKNESYKVASFAGNWVSEPDYGMAPTEKGMCYNATVTAADGIQYYVICDVVLEDEEHFLNNLSLHYSVIGLNGVVLEENTDYQIVYARDMRQVAITEAGDYQLAFVGKSSYIGNVFEDFTVKEAITYLDFDETTGEFTEKPVPSGFRIIDSSMTTWTSGWYVLTEDVTFQDGAKNIRIDLAANADVKLVLCNGYKMTVTNGIKVGSGSKLTIYGQEGNTGRLESSGYEARMAGIGGYYTGSTSSSACGDITINGGTIIANGSTKAAGIGGGGTDGVPAPNGTITINGGNVTAKGSTKVNDNAAGIGGGNYQVGGNIIIRGGVIDATSRNGGSGIGKGSGNVNDDNTTITLDPYNMNSLQVKSNSYGGKVVLKTNFKDKNGTDVFKSSENFQNKNLLANKTIVPCDLDVYTYTVDPNNGNSKTSTDYVDETEITLPTPVAVSDSWAFEGWQLNDDTDLKAAGYQFGLNEDVTAKAIWKCSVTISDTIEHGSVTCETTQAKVGDTITLTVVPDANLRYFAKSVTASYTENGSGTINATADESDATVYTFTMPNAPVTVSASFEVDKDDLNAGWAHKRPILTWDESSVADYYTVQIDEEAEINVGSATTYDVTDYIVEHGAWSKSHSYSIKGYTNDDILVAESNIDKCRFHIIDVQIHTSGGDGSETGGSLFFETDGDVQKVDATGTKLYYLSDEAEPTELSVSYECNKGFYETDGKIYVHENKIYPITYLLDNGGSFPAYSSSESTFIVEVYFNKDSSTKGVRIDCGAYSGESDLALQEIKSNYDEEAYKEYPNILHYDTIKLQTVGDLLDEVNRILTDAGVEAHNGNSFRVGLKESYSSYQEYYADIEENRDKKLNEYTPDDTDYDEDDEEITIPVPVSLYIQWLPIVSEVNITANEPVCGASNPPVIEIQNNADNKVTSEVQTWADSDSKTVISGTIHGGDSVLLMLDLYPSFEYALTENTVVKINGKAATVSAKEGGGILVEKEYVAEHVFDANNVCTVCGEKALPKFAGHSVLLTGYIGLVFWLDLPEIDGRIYDEVVFTVPGRSGGEQSVNVDMYSSAMRDSEGRYGYTCELNALQMAQEVTAVLHYRDGGEQTIENTFSVQDYIQAFKEEAAADQTKYDQTTQELVQALYDYGYYVQDFLMDYHNLTPGADTYVRMSEDGVTSYNLDEYKTISNSTEYLVDRAVNEDIDAITFSVNFDSSTSIYVYIKMKEGTEATLTGVTVDGDSYDPELRPDGRYRVKITDIKASKFDDRYRIEVSTSADNTPAHIEVCVLSYMNLPFTSDKAALSNESAKKAVCALYEYYAEADAYSRTPH